MKNLTSFEKICFGLILLISVVIQSDVIAQEDWMPLETPTDANLNAIDFVNAMKGIAVGDNGTVIITNDGGLSWTLINSHVSNNLKSISFIDEDHAVAVGDGGQIIVTEDGGTNWTSHWLPGIQNNLYAVDMTPEGKGIIGGQHSTLLYTVNGGINWSIIQEGDPGFCWSVRYYNDSIAYVFGHIFEYKATGTIRKLVNGCVTEMFSVYFDFENGEHEGSIQDGYIFDEESIVTVGKVNLMYPRYISNISCNQDLNSTLWSSCYTEENCYLNGVDFIGSFGVAVGGQIMGDEAPSILESNDMGESWEMIYKGRAGDPNMNDVVLVENTGYVVGNNGTVWKKLLPTGINQVSEDLNTLTVTPNPVSENSIVSFDLPSSGVVQLTLYDINGRLVSNIYNGNMSAGIHSLNLFDNYSGNQFMRGIYLLKLETQNSVSTTKVVF
jgi:photosystem II stability/assembly factor-like uncharacterized protein